MLIQSIRNRLKAVEQATKPTEFPDIVFICWDAEKRQWNAKEQYSKKDARGNVIPLSGWKRIVPLENSNSYKPPEGFKGVILKEGEL